MKRKKTVIAFIVLSVYLSSYCLLRLSKALVHQKVFLVKTGFTGDGRSIRHILHDIGRGSYTDSDNYNKTKTPGAFAVASKSIYYPLVKLEISYWKYSQPDEIFTEWCSE
jgi:hypothetical protein